MLHRNCGYYDMQATLTFKSFCLFKFNWLVHLFISLLFWCLLWFNVVTDVLFCCELPRVTLLVRWKVYKLRYKKLTFIVTFLCFTMQLINGFLFLCVNTLYLLLPSTPFFLYITSVHKPDGQACLLLLLVFHITLKDKPCMKGKIKITY